jgi:ankyrin repeat protein
MCSIASDNHNSPIPTPYLTVWQYGFTALICASSNGHLPVCELLVDKGADKEAKGNVSGERDEKCFCVYCFFLCG